MLKKIYFHNHHSTFYSMLTQLNTLQLSKDTWNGNGRWKTSENWR